MGVFNLIKKIIAMLLVVTNLLLAVNPIYIYGEEIAELETPCYVLMEASTGQVICGNNQDEPLHPASVTKIMTLILIFEALESGKINLGDEVSISENAASMGGSQVFLEPNEIQTVDTLIKCICVASANDASVAMAEYVWGSEEAFVAKMNEKAEQLGMTNTHFVNCCGLDDDNHKMSTLDVAIMSRELIVKHPKIKEYSTIWMDTITHTTRKGTSEFGLSNTNKLIKQYQWATGLKTGSTSKAKCCLSATAKKDDTELIAVVMAAPNSKTRFADAITLLNYGFSVCNIYKDDNKNTYYVPVENSMKKKVACGVKEEFSYLFTNTYDKEKITVETEYRNNLKAPIRKGECVGQALYKYDGVLMGKTDIISLENVKESRFGDYFKEIMSEFWG